MSETKSQQNSANGSPAVKPVRTRRVKPPQHGGPRIAPASREASRVAAAVLEVLAGARTPTAAAEALSVSLPRYYQLELRAVGGLVAACEPRRKGPTVSPQRQVAALEKQVVRLEQECTRQQALVRAAQRTIGLAPTTAPAAAKGAAKSASNGAPRAKRKRRPVSRALKAAATLRAAAEREPATAGDEAAATSSDSIAAGNP